MKHIIYVLGKERTGGRLRATEDKQHKYDEHTCKSMKKKRSLQGKDGVSSVREILKRGDKVAFRVPVCEQGSKLGANPG